MSDTCAAAKTIQIALGLLLLFPSAAAGKLLNAPQRLTIEDLINVNEVGSVYSIPSQVQISPDGKRVVYQMRRTLLAENKYVFDLWLVNTSGVARPQQLTHNAPTTNFRHLLMPRWSPDSRSIAFFSTPAGESEIHLIQLDNQREKVLARGQGILGGFDSKRNAGVMTEFKWSPDGNYIAFVASVNESNSQNDPETGVQVDVDWYPGAGWVPLPPAILCTIDVHSGKVRRLTESTLNVEGFDWSPDSRRLVFSASKEVKVISFMNTDLYIVEHESQKIIPLLEQPGPDREPVWSPDGNWIAFSSQMGEEDWLYVTVPAVIRVSGGPPIYPTKYFLNELYDGPRNVGWSGDSTQLYFEAPYHMSSHLFRIALDARSAPSLITPEDGRYYSHFSYSKGGQLVAFAIQSVTEPADIYVSRLDAFKPIRLTDVNPQLNGIPRASSETLEWRSKDDRWDIHGIVVKPPDFKSGKLYPLLVFNEGGPSMAAMRYDFAAQYPINVLAANGYVILSPNTRGRGGYGKAFHHAIGDEKSLGPNPLSDMLAGVDLLVEKGIADPNREGIMGFSYGCYLTAYAITQTARFKAASVNDGVVDLASDILLQGGSAWRLSLQRVMSGFGPPYDPHELSEMMRQSAIFNIQRVSTPVLLEYGVNGAAPTQGKMFYEGLQYFQVPSEFIVYPRTAHGITEPQLRENSFRRNLAWLDYWLLDRPYSNPRLQVQYDDWKRRHPRPASGP
jgi:dipeptidyl aminopeptidase/acylaminoacyl peptidase